MVSRRFSHTGVVSFRPLLSVAKLKHNSDHAEFEEVMLIALAHELASYKLSEQHSLRSGHHCIRDDPPIQSNLTAVVLSMPQIDERGCCRLWFFLTALRVQNSRMFDVWNYRV